MLLFKACFCGLHDKNDDDDDNIERQEIEIRSDKRSMVSSEVVHTSLSSKDVPTTFPPRQSPSKNVSGNAMMIPVESKHSLLLITTGIIMYAVASYIYLLGFDIILAAQSLIMFIYRTLEPFAPTIVMIEFFVLPFYFQIRGRPITRRKKFYQPSSGLRFDTNIDTDNETVSSSSSFSTESSLQQSNGSMISRNGDNIGFEEALKNLPDISDWKYHTIFIQPAGETRCPGLQSNQSVPLGIPVEFESDLFKGKILFRFREGNTDDEKGHMAYFNSSKYKVQRQIVIQGQFKRRLKMSEMYMGDIFDKRWVLSPPPRLGRMVSNIFTRLAPGLIIDIAVEKPKILALIGGGSHAISINDPGDEPDMTAPDIPENTFLSDTIKLSETRKKVLGNPKEASQFEFDTNMVYTFHSFDEVLDLANFQFKIPFTKVDIAKALGDQPISVRAVTRPVDDAYESLFFFRIWHERTVTRLKSKLLDK